MDPLKIIAKYYPPDGPTYPVLVAHSRAVADKALAIAKNVPELNPDLKFIEEAAMLHDIGIFMTDNPSVDCNGKYEYICHGYLGRQLLEKEGYPKHALVCERHVGVGLSEQDIIDRDLPIPHRDMTPQTIEEEIICLADKFFSKHPDPTKEKSWEEVEESMGIWSDNDVARFKHLVEKYKLKQNV